MRVAGSLGIDVDDIAVLRLQVEIHVLESGQVLGEEPRADQQYQRERGLKDDQSALEEGCARGGGSGAAAQGFGRIGLCRDPCGSYAKQNAGQKRQSAGEGKDDRRRACLDGNTLGIRKGQGQEHTRACIGNDKSRDSADHGEHQTLGEKLTDDAGAGRAQSCAHRQFSFTRHAASEQQICDIGAGDQEHKTGDGHQHLEVQSVFVLKRLDAATAWREDNVNLRQ